MGDTSVARYWCHVCMQMVNPVMDVEIKCPFCDSGFVEEMDGRRDDSDLGSDRALYLLGPILHGMMSSHSRPRRFPGEEDEEELQGEHEQEQELQDLESILRRRRRRRRRSSTAILQLLQRLESSESDILEREMDREHVMLINPFNEALILEGSFDSNETQNESQNPPGSLGDYFIGPGLDMLLQHLAENDPSRYGTPPAQKEAIEAMPTVKITEKLQCSVCLDDFDIGSEAKEMPCKHKFHCMCIMPWLELHSSCPICRFQLPADGSKVVNGPENGNRAESSDEGRNGNGRSISVPVPWPFNEMFSLSGTEGGLNSP